METDETDATDSMTDVELELREKLSDEDMSKLEDGKVSDLYVDDEEPHLSMLEVNGKKYKLWTKPTTLGRVLQIKGDVWKEVKGDRELYDLHIRHRLVKEMLKKVNDTNCDDLFWLRLDGEVGEFIIDKIQGPALMDNPIDIEVVKNFMRELLKDGPPSGNGPTPKKNDQN